MLRHPFNEISLAALRGEAEHLAALCLDRLAVLRDLEVTGAHAHWLTCERLDARAPQTAVRPYNIDFKSAASAEAAHAAVRPDARQRRQQPHLTRVTLQQH